jgi:hypothetical protein
LPFTFQMIGAVLVELGTGDIKAEPDVLADAVTSLVDGFEDGLDGFLVGTQVRRKATLVADCGIEATSLQYRLQRMKHLGTRTQGLGKTRQAHRQDHELLHVHIVVGMRTTVDDVHHRHRQPCRTITSQMLPQGQLP